MKEAIKINDEDRDQQKLTKEELEQVTGGEVPPWRNCDHNCNDCDATGCLFRGKSDKASYLIKRDA